MVVNELRVLDYIIYCGMRTYTVDTPEAIWAMPLRPQVESNIEPERGKLRAKPIWSSLSLHVYEAPSWLGRSYYYDCYRQYVTLFP